MAELYDYPQGHVGRKSYVSVRGHSRSVPKYKTYRGRDGLNHLLPEYGGSLDEGNFGRGADIVPDKAAYYSPLDRTVVEGRKAHRSHMDRHNVYEAGDMRLGEFSHIERAPMPSVRESFLRARAEYT